MTAEEGNITVLQKAVEPNSLESLQAGKNLMS